MEQVWNIFDKEEDCKFINEKLWQDIARPDLCNPDGFITTKAFDEVKHPLLNLWAVALLEHEGRYIDRIYVHSQFIIVNLINWYKVRNLVTEEQEYNIIENLNKHIGKEIEIDLVITPQIKSASKTRSQMEEIGFFSEVGDV